MLEPGIFTMKLQILEILDAHTNFIISLYYLLQITRLVCLFFKHKLHEAFPTITPPLPCPGMHAQKLFDVLPHALRVRESLILLRVTLAVTKCHCMV